MRDRVGGQLARVRDDPSRRSGPRRCAGRCAAGCRRPATSPAPTASISLADGDHRLAEAVELGQRLALGRLDHQRAGHREAHRRRVEAVVDQPLGDVVDGDAGRLGDRPQVEDALVGDEAVRRPCTAPGSARRSRRGDVVGRQRSRRRWRRAQARRRPSSAMYAHGIGRIAGRPVRRGRHRHRPALSSSVAADGRAGTARGARAPPTGPTPGPPPPCGMQNVLCRLRWLTSAPNSPGPGEADERVEVGAVDVHLAAGVVHQRRRSRAIVVLEHAVRRRVGDHQRGEAVARAAAILARRSSRSTLPSVVAGHDDDPHARPSRADAALVPCALDGIRQTSRLGLAARRGGRRGWRAGRRTRPGLPALGCKLTPRRSR